MTNRERDDEVRAAALALLAGVAERLQRDYFGQWLAGTSESDRALKARASVIGDVLDSVRSGIRVEGFREDVIDGE